MILRRMAIVMAAAGVSALFGPGALAQYPQARLSSVSRPGVCAGETAEVTLRGSDLEGASGSGSIILVFRPCT